MTALAAAAEHTVALLLALARNIPFAHADVRSGGWNRKAFTDAGLLVLNLISSPGSGKTTLLEHLGVSIATNHPECDLMVLLIDERPEEVTAFRRATALHDLDREPTRPVFELAHLRKKPDAQLVELGEGCC